VNDTPNRSRPEPKDLYKILIDTRNLEINLFWQRSNYFLVLNTGIAFGFFNVANAKFQWVFPFFGLLGSLLWLAVCLGGKYWQTRWEQTLSEFEVNNFGPLEFFSASRPFLDETVKKGLDPASRHGLEAIVYGWVLKLKPSVSYSMIRLALLFIIGWMIFIGIAVVGGTPGQ
jgi:hypothetical protein